MPKRNLAAYAEAIAQSGLTIYDSIPVGHPKLWIPSRELEQILNSGLKGLSLRGLPLRTRSKVVKERICKVLGYPAPTSFKRTKPRFPGQNLDAYIQKSNNLQVWNDELSLARRYAILRVTATDKIEKIKVVAGDALAALDTTGTLTQKYQARVTPGTAPTELYSKSDTDNLLPLVGKPPFPTNFSASPVDYPESRKLLPIRMVFERLSALVGKTLKDPGIVQERNRGAGIHRLLAHYLGYKESHDDGRFPDIRHQLLEAKLQTSPTIDLGLVCPNSKDPLEIPSIDSRTIRHCDVRYAVFYGKSSGGRVTLTNLFVTTGRDFFNRFPQFQGKVLNKKSQIPLPRDFFDSESEGSPD